LQNIVAKDMFTQGSLHICEKVKGGVEI